MGTNYYLQQNACQCCNRSDKVHIGKRFAAGGGKVGFTVSRDNIDVDADAREALYYFINYLDDAVVIDDYGRKFNRLQFREIILECSSFKAIAGEFC